MFQSKCGITGQMTSNPETTILFVRHGEVHNPNHIMYGRIPRFGLSENGRNEAIQTATWLKSLPVDTIFTSPMLRARQTAKIISNRLTPAPPVRQTKQLIEVDSPFEGGPLEEVRLRGWDLYTGIDPTYEQPDDILERVRRWTTSVRKAYAGKHVVGVTHGDVIMYHCMWAEAAPFDHDSKLAFAQDYYGDEYLGTASVSSFTYRSDDPDERPIFRYFDINQNGNH